MPLTERVKFKMVLQKGNRVQVPKVIRWQFKMDSEQVLKVTVNALNVWSGWETFYARRGKDGGITISEVDAGTAARAGNRVSQATLWKWFLNMEKGRG